MAAWPPNLEEAGWEPTHWAYLAEGGANIIYRYTGPPEWPFVNTLGNGQSIVLRVKKEVPEPDAHVVPYPDDLENVIAHLLPTSSLPVLRKIPVDDQLRTFLQTLVHQSEQVRPSSRRTKSNIDLSAPFIWAMPDLSRSSVPGSFVVEIKVCTSDTQFSQSAGFCLLYKLNIHASVQCHAIECIACSRRYNHHHLHLI